MDNVTIVFIICCTILPLMILGINNQSINDFYTYDVPLDDFIPRHNIFHHNAADVFANLNDAKCISTIHNEFCYDELLTSTPVTSMSGLDGEIVLKHIDSNNTGYSTIRQMSVDNDLITATFESDGWNHITNDAELNIKLELNDSVITGCFDNPDGGTNAILVMYLGIKTINDVDHFMTWHGIITSGDLSVQCSYPETIHASIGHDFGV